MFSKESEEEHDGQEDGEQVNEHNPEEDDEDQMSDYIDENFELDETDEHWNKEQLLLKQIQPNKNDIKHVTSKCLHLRNDPQIKINANYKYVIPFEGH